MGRLAIRIDPTPPPNGRGLSTGHGASRHTHASRSTGRRIRATRATGRATHAVCGSARATGRTRATRGAGAIHARSNTGPASRAMSIGSATRTSDTDPTGRDTSRARRISRISACASRTGRPAANSASPTVGGMHTRRSAANGTTRADGATRTAASTGRAARISRRATNSTNSTSRSTGRA